MKTGIRSAFRPVPRNLRDARSHPNVEVKSTFRKTGSRHGRD